VAIQEVQDSSVPNPEPGFFGWSGAENTTFAINAKQTNVCYF
jgi:hypothetical protein